MKLGEDGRVEFDGPPQCACKDAGPAQCPLHWRHADEVIAKCGLCDPDGYRLPGGSVVCDHVDRQQIAARGIAKVRAVLAKDQDSGR